MAGRILFMTDDENFRSSLERELYLHTVYTHQYKTSALAFSESKMIIDAVIFDFRSDNVEKLAFAILINSLLEKKHLKLLKIICVPFNRLDSNIMRQVSFKYEPAITTQQGFHGTIEEYLRPITERAQTRQKHRTSRLRQHSWPLSHLPDFKDSKYNRTTINVDISKEGIEGLSIALDKPMPLSELSMISELAPVAYLESNYYGPKTEKAKVLGINRMKYTRLVSELNRKRNDHIFTNFAK